jgi:hypothetical protein
MGLSPSDTKPENISVADAYSAIRTWYQNHVTNVEDRGDDYSRRSAQLIRHLPSVSQLSDLDAQGHSRSFAAAYIAL